MKAPWAVVSLILTAAGSPNRESVVEKLPACVKSQLVSTAEWVRLDQREGFALRLPACFEPDPETPRFVHGGQRWRCGSMKVEVVWGMWGLESFGEEQQCKSTLAGFPVMVARRTAETGRSVLVWYLTGMVHEPIILASSDKAADEALLTTIAFSGELTARGATK